MTQTFFVPLNPGFLYGTLEGTFKAGYRNSGIDNEGLQGRGTVLTLILVGTLLLITAVIAAPGVSAYISAVVGSITVAVVLTRIYYVKIQEIKKATKIVKNNEVFLNSIQSTAIQLTELTCTCRRSM